MANPYLQAVLAVDRWRWAERNFVEFSQMVTNSTKPDDLFAEIDERIVQSKRDSQLTLDK